MNLKIKTTCVSLAFMTLTMLMTSCNKDDVIDEKPSNGFRPVTPQSSASVSEVFEWTPAPGQFINDPTGGNSWPESMTPAQAAAWAKERLAKRYTVSLGAFGGRIIAGFDHSVANTGGYEIGILGNAFLSANGDSNEPGIVYVMQDTNGNGLPDDIWYELRGSDTFAEGTVRNYAVTYYRPEAPKQPVRWTDNLGNSGQIEYLGVYHDQPSYFPVWIKSDSYTLSGTRLEPRSFRNPETGNWSNPPFAWGYADNIGEDNTIYDGETNCNRFRISDAIDLEGKSVKLDYIDFVGVQTALLFNAGHLGENSTEVRDIIDLTLYAR